MVNIAQVQRGVTRFVDNELAQAYSGIEKAILLGGTALLAANLDAIIKMYASKPIVAALGVYDPVANTVDIDALYNAFVPHMGEDKIPIALPKMGSIDLGTIKLGKNEIDTLVRYIKEA